VKIAGIINGDFDHDELWDVGVHLSSEGSEGSRHVKGLQRNDGKRSAGCQPASLGSLPRLVERHNSMRESVGVAGKLPPTAG
jgi:hypothetical protein